MLPAEVRMIAYFHDVLIEDIDDRNFIHKLSYLNVTNELSDVEAETLFRIYNGHAPDLNEDLVIIRELLAQLKEIENCKFTFTDVEGNAVLNHYDKPIEGEF